MFKTRFKEQKTVIRDPLNEKNRFDVELLKKYINGADIKELSDERLISRASVQNKINQTALYLKNVSSVDIPEGATKDVLKYKSEWLDIIDEFQTASILYEPGSFYHTILEYAKELNIKESARLINDLTEIHHDKDNN